jgi:hydroxypyruvate isomerase
MPRFSANLSMLFTEIELIDRFEAAHAAGFEAVEIQFPYELSAEAIRRKLDEHDLQLVLFNVPADDLLQGGAGLACVPEKQGCFREALALAVDYAQVLRPTAINVLPGRCLDPLRFDACLDIFKHNLGLTADAFTPLGVKTVFEAINSLDMPGFLIDTGSKMLAVQSELQRTDIWLQYDIYHMLRMREDPVAFITEYADRIGHIQFADCPGRSQPGTGDADWARIFSAIDRSGYNGWTGAEYKSAGETSASLGWLHHFR